MIVPMKKAVVLVRNSEKESALLALRRLGLLHIEEMHGSGENLQKSTEKANGLERALNMLTSLSKKPPKQKDAAEKKAQARAEEALRLEDEKKACISELASVRSELERLSVWGEIRPNELSALSEKGVLLIPLEVPLSELSALSDDTALIEVNKTKTTAYLIAVNPAEDFAVHYRLKLPNVSTDEMKKREAEILKRLPEIENELLSLCAYTDAMKEALKSAEKDVELENLTSAMPIESVSPSENEVSVAYILGYIPEKDVKALSKAAKKNAWGIALDDPTEEDNVPTELSNNKFVSLIYPLTDFLGTVPGYFEYDISAWFLGFILVFFGIIFGDGGYGLLICAVAAALIAKSRASGKGILPAYLLIFLLGGATVIWGTLTCTWFGLSPEQLPQWLTKLSLPVFSNVYADRIWYPFWTNGEVGLTTAQNVQIFCFSLALFQLSAAHVIGAIRNRKSLKVLSDIGSVLQLLGIFYVVLSLVVSSAVFPLSLVIGGVPIGTIAIITVAAGFVLSFTFANYEGSIVASLLESAKNIISVFLGVVNVFSDIVSYIRLWAVGLAGAAISATVNELAGPMLGKLSFIIFGIFLLVFGHGLNMILNVLSVIVHGVRLNTLEFSSHLDMSWSGHKYEPFKE